MRRSTLWSAIQIDGDDLLSGPLNIRLFSSAESEKRAGQWEKDVDDIITQKLSKYTSSWAVMKALSDSGLNVVIVPELEKSCNSTTYPKSDQDAARAGTAANHCSKPKTGDNLGSGKGTSSKITFMPSHWAVKGGCDAGGAGRDGDEILIHELCHAMRYATGMRDACFDDIPVGYGDYEEFVSVMLTNIYSSQTRRQLRRDHVGFRPLPPTTRLFHRGQPVQVDLHDPCKFCNWFRPHLENLKTYQKTLVHNLASYRNIPWNPFYYL